MKKIIGIFLISLFCIMMLEVNSKEENNLNSEKIITSLKSNKVMKLSTNNAEKDSLSLDEMIVPTDADIDVVDMDKKLDVSEELSAIGDISYLQGIQVEDQVYRLYPEFVDVKSAMKNIKEKCPNAIAYIMDNGIQSLSEKNFSEWHAYTNVLTIEEENLNEELMKEVRLLDAFLNIYENTTLNQEVGNVIEVAEGNLENSSVLEASNIISELQYIVPYNTGCNEALNTVTEKIYADVEEKYNLDHNELQMMYENEQKEISGIQKKIIVLKG